MAIIRGGGRETGSGQCRHSNITLYKLHGLVVHEPFESDGGRLPSGLVSALRAHDEVT